MKKKICRNKSQFVICFINRKKRLKTKAFTATCVLDKNANINAKRPDDADPCCGCDGPEWK